MKRYKNLLLVVLCAFVALVIFAGCGNEGSGFPVAPEEPTITIKKVTGLVLFCNGNVVAVVESDNVTGTVAAKMDQNSDIFEVEFLDEKGDIINSDPQQHGLAWKNDKQYATFEQHTDWEFCIYGKKNGETTFKLLLENGAGVDYSSPAIPLEIK
jgi:hypothetical protein